MSGNRNENFLKFGGPAGEGWVFSVAERTLRTDAGQIVPLRRQSAMVLETLLRADGSILGKEQLISHVWGKAAVSDDSLSQCISDIRRALKDNDRRLLVTHTGKGYALGRPRAKNIVAGLEAAPHYVATIPRIAVLAFDDFSMGEDKDFLSDAIAEGVIMQLARFKTIDVIARNSSFHYKGKHVDVRHIGEELGVHYVLEGSQQKSGELLKVTVQLIEAETGSHLWAHTYDLEIGDLFTIQDQIVNTIANRIGVRIQHPIASADPERVSSLHWYLRGLSNIRKDFSAETNEKNKELCENAIKAGPDAPYGYVGMAWYFRNSAHFGWHNLERGHALKMGFKSAGHALRIAPENPDVHYILACLSLEANMLDQSRLALEKAIELNPSDSSYVAGSATLSLLEGETGKAIACLEAAMGIDPYHLDWFHGQMAWAQWELGDSVAALGSMNKMERVQQADQQMLAAIHADLGNVEEARKAYRTYYANGKEPTTSQYRAEWEERWISPGSLDRWIQQMRVAGMRD